MKKVGFFFFFFFFFPFSHFSFSMLINKSLQGKAILLFDNHYSWTTSKTVNLTFTVSAPGHYLIFLLFF